MSRLHPVFPVVKLTPKPVDPFPGRHPKKPPDPILVDEEEEYFVEKILDSCLRSGKLEFLVKWEGYGYEENQWVPEDNIHASELVKEFYKRHSGAPRRIRVVDFDVFRKSSASRRSTLKEEEGIANNK